MDFQRYYNRKAKSFFFIKKWLLAMYYLRSGHWVLYFIVRPLFSTSFFLDTTREEGVKRNVARDQTERTESDYTHTHQAPFFIYFLLLFAGRHLLLFCVPSIKSVGPEHPILLRRATRMSADHDHHHDHKKRWSIDIEINHVYVHKYVI